ncbi:carbohydrate ABC transporter permease [Microlunatus parietis]|uniref:Multiple sugar transport system permease protein n=1 Tax=Microlunatus parietis TaxID=682979 RepID=A0A7Y9I9A9_9ACTN|nr:sugar ABC transporter permease [Microlunatus parietis]NYE72693.1 multiple sugar transport system permease protein [Microlunatus parietis]
MTTLAMRGVRPEDKRAERPARRGQRGRLTLWVWLFLLPTAILYGLYTLYPIVASYWYSLVEWNGFESEQRFVGLANYQAVFADPMFWSSFKITLIFMLLVAPARVILSFLLAIVLNSPKLPLARLFRTAFFLPVVTTTAIVGVVMQFVLDPASGPLNSLLQALGHGGGISFLGDSQTALITASVVYVWKFFGITLVYWLAALQTIPSELYEAARIDGAGAVQLFTQITVPLLKPFLIIISLLTIEDSFRAFDLMQTLTGGGPYFATEVIEIYIYQRAFTAPIPQLGFASAAAVLFGLFVFVVGLIQLWGVWAARRLRAGA